ncbi:MAG: N-acetylmuramoyl-L-alanine amidase [Formivibrio sp.]|nr:N-acetylmuramoyl-L-alanine amidase [Formivibrio sp.]
MKAKYQKWIVIVAASFFTLAANAANIVVDTGHTPLRPGATGASGKVEYLYNLQFTDALANELVTQGDKVFRVAADGKEITLQERAIREPTADFFVSIHHDSIQQEWINAGRRREFAGFSIFVSEKNPHYAKSLHCAREIAEQLLAIGEVPSLYHATPIPGENRPLIDQRLGIHRFDDLIVLKTAPIPAVLIEVGVIANPDEEERLNKSETVQRLAHAVATGIHVCQKP